MESVLTMDMQDVLESAESETVAKKKELQPISVSRKRFGYAERMLYRVYSSPAKFELVEAQSAHEAFEKSGIANPHKIEREAFYRYVALPPELVTHSETDERVETDIRMPDPEEMNTLLVAALELDAYEASKPTFESMELAALHAKVIPEEVFIEPPQEEPEPVAEAQPEPEPEPEPDVGDSKELTPEEVEALLNAEP